MLIKITTLVLSISGLLSSIIVARYSLTHSFAWHLTLGFVEEISAVFFVIVIGFVVYDIWKGWNRV